MPLAVDYYFAPQSPYAYLGHQRFDDIVRTAGAKVNVLPIDVGGNERRITRVFETEGEA